MVSVVVSIRVRKMFAEVRKIFLNAQRAEQDVREAGELELLSLFHVCLKPPDKREVGSSTLPSPFNQKHSSRWVALMLDCSLGYVNWCSRTSSRSPYWSEVLV
jgi:hypothetical protein